MDQLIQSLKDKIKEHRSTYNHNEAAVRRQLIDPLLDELGWQTDSPSHVLHNETTEDRDIPDYSLIRNTKVETYVEAKNLSKNIIDHLPQLARYCINNGKEFGIITNGNDWLLIKSFEKDTKPKDRIVWRISIENDSISNIKNKLGTITRTQIVNLSELVEKEKQLNSFWENIISDNNILIEKFSKEISNHFLSIHSDDDFEKETIESFFHSKLSVYLRGRNAILNSVIYSDPVSYSSGNGIGISSLKKTGTPSVSDWLQLIPELRKISGLNSWKAVCDYLKIPVEGDSARRRLKIWVDLNRPGWVRVPEPK
jgi:predicted type IV restriction endonuclease